MEGLFSKQNLLIPFNCLVDIDFGMIKLIENEFLDSDYIDRSIYKYSDNQITYILLNRLYENALSVVMMEYNDFLESNIYGSYKSKILSLSRYTDIINILITTKKLNLLNITILCRDLQEEQFIRKHIMSFNENIRIIINDDIAKINFDLYNTIFIDRISNLEKIKNNIPLNNIYLYKARYNLEKKDEIFQIPESITDYIDISNISLISPYIMDDTFNIKNNIKGGIK